MNGAIDSHWMDSLQNNVEELYETGLTAFARQFAGGSDDDVVDGKQERRLYTGGSASTTSERLHERKQEERGGGIIPEGGGGGRTSPTTKIRPASFYYVNEEDEDESFNAEIGEDEQLGGEKNKNSRATTRNREHHHAGAASYQARRGAANGANQLLHQVSTSVHQNFKYARKNFKRFEHNHVPNLRPVVSRLWTENFLPVVQQLGELATNTRGGRGNATTTDGSSRSCTPGRTQPQVPHKSTSTRNKSNNIKHPQIMNGVVQQEADDFSKHQNVDVFNAASCSSSSTSPSKILESSPGSHLQQLPTFRIDPGEIPMQMENFRGFEVPTFLSSTRTTSSRKRNERAQDNFHFDFSTTRNENEILNYARTRTTTSTAPQHYVSSPQVAHDGGFVHDEQHLVALQHDRREAAGCGPPGAQLFSRTSKGSSIFLREQDLDQDIAAHEERQLRGTMLTSARMSKDYEINPLFSRTSKGSSLAEEVQELYSYTRTSGAGAADGENPSLGAPPIHFNIASSVDEEVVCNHEQKEKPKRLGRPAAEVDAEAVVDLGGEEQESSSKDSSWLKLKM
ncbi:unnamed protein product [Amoebophrya sp. A120]|nr:unnamed protein product [Amoebophrya sp. A120]|eukprot:GSA120T00013609001.1